MEIFSSSVLKREFEELVNEIIPSLADCRRCEKFCCFYCKKFAVTCTRCRNERCKNCCKFESSLKILLENGNETSKQYVANFVDDFFSIGDIAAKFFNLNVCSIEQRKKDRINFVKSYAKSSKCRTQIVNQSLKNTQKIQYGFKGKKHHFYKKKND